MMTELYSITTAAGTTFILALDALTIGLLLAIGFAALELVRWRWIALSVTMLVALLRGLPEILVVLFIYFGALQLSVILADGVTLSLWTLHFSLVIPIRNFDISPFLCGVIALALLYAAYASQILRGALKAIAHGQWESGQALGMSNGITFFRVILPQMWSHALPGLGNQWLVLLKDTALVSLISVNELMLQTKSIISFTQQPFTWYLLAAAVYLMITLFSQIILHSCERYATRFVKGHLDG